MYHVAEAHGGTVTAMNCPEGGAAFTIKIPRRIDASRRMSRKAEDTTNRFRVLVVDDHARPAKRWPTCCARREYDVATCASAIEALGRLARQPVDVVVTDLQMPGMDGLEFIREIERRRLDVQVLMITAHASVASAVEAMRHGAFDYIEKPFERWRWSDRWRRRASAQRLCSR